MTQTNLGRRANPSF